MTAVNNRKGSSDAIAASDVAAIGCLERAIAGGQHWYIALLEAIALWSSTEETFDGRNYRYLIAGEAFDWLLLAERLCSAVDGLLPDSEKTSLLFQGKPPLKLSREEFSRLIGGSKYRQYLNYFYGITVEEALILAVQDEVRKERRTRGYTDDRDAADEVYRRIYGATRDTLLQRFKQGKGYSRARSMSLIMLKEFTYWLFRYRLQNCDSTRVASDTKKALKRLSAMGFYHPWEAGR
ncbi:MAG TPA: hypothetical protein G4O09_08340 [Dehalococcoidia bacterium]|nr:hypothetical protein [Dehalococcoidia bacterium]